MFEEGNKKESDILESILSDFKEQALTSEKKRYEYFGTSYIVFIDFDPKVMKEEEVKDFVDTHFDFGEEFEGQEITLLRLKGHELAVHWQTPDKKYSYDIINDLFYILEEEKYGTYSFVYRS